MKKGILSITVLLLTATSLAKTVYFEEGKTVRINIDYRYSQALKGSEPTLFRFPTDVYSVDGTSKFKIQSIGRDEDSFSDLKVTPYFTGGNESLQFILVDGTEVEVIARVSKYHAVKPASFYEFKPKIPYQDKNSYKFKGMKQVDFMRKIISSSKNKFKSKKINIKQTCDSRGLEFIFKESIVGSGHLAYKIEVTNKSKTLYKIFPQNLLIRGRDPKKSFLVYSKEPSISKKGANSIIIVTEEKIRPKNIFLCGQKNMFIETKELAQKNPINEVKKYVMSPRKLIKSSRANKIYFAKGVKGGKNNTKSKKNR